RAKRDGLTPSLMHRAVAAQPDISRKKIFVRREDFLEICRASFFFAFKRELDVRFHLQAGRADRIDRGQYRDDGRFVICSATRIKPPFRIERRTRAGPWNRLAIVFERLVAQRRSKRRRSPFFGIERLAIVMSVKNNSARRTRRFDFAEYDWGRAGQ